MKWTKKVALIALLSGAYTPGVMAATGFCIEDPAFDQLWEIKSIQCDGMDCLLEMDRIAASPTPAPGALNWHGDTWFFDWNGSFAGPTQGTLAFSCQIDSTGSLPYTGPGMLQRNASFTGGTAEHITGDCALDLCSNFRQSARADLEDKATRQ